jgi:hypothetical protein
LWAAEFSLLFCRSFSNAADVYNAVGCMTRVAQFLLQALFALNKEYFISDKHANRFLDQFARRPRDFAARLTDVLSSPGREAAELLRSAELLQALWIETFEPTT